MSFPKSRFVGIPAFISTGFVFLILVSILILSNVIIPGEIRRYIEEASRDAGYKVKIGDIVFNLFSGLIGSDVEIFDRLNPTNPILKVKNMVVRPEIISSLISRKIKIREIIVDNSSIYLTRGRFNNLAKLIKKEAAGSNEKKEKYVLFEIERLIITDARVEFVSQVPIHIKKIEADLRDAGLGEKGGVNLSGLIDVKSNQMEIQGKIRPFLDKPTGELRINLPQLNTQSFSNVSFLPNEVDVFLYSRFQISSGIASQGVINFESAKSKNEKNSPFSVKINYDLTYDGLKDAVFVNSLNLDLNGLIHTSFAGDVKRLTKEAIFNIRGEAKTIRLEDITSWFPGLSSAEFSGDAEPSNLKITGSVRDKNIYLGGDVSLIGVNVNDKSSGLQIIRLKGDFNFKQCLGGHVPEAFLAQGNFSLRRLRIGNLDVNGISGNVQFIPSEDGIVLSSKGLSYENLSFNKAAVHRGHATVLEFNLGRDNYWTLDINSYGSQFNMSGEGIYMREFQTEIHIWKNKKIGVWGRLDGKGGIYKDVSFPIVFFDFRFGDDLLNLTNLNVAVGDYGELKTENLNILFREKKAYILTFTRGTFSGFDNGVKSEGISGEFRFNVRDGREPIWDGSISIGEAYILKSRLKDMSFHISPNRSGIDVKNISGRFLSGDLEGNIRIKTVSPAFISSEIEIKNINLNKVISLRALNFRFGGEFKKGLLPQGEGEVNAGLKLGQYSAVNLLSGRMRIKTVGETIVLEDGFIENGSGEIIRFIGRLENSLDTVRRLRIDLPESLLASIKGILSPILPEALRGAEIRGNTSLNLVLDITNKGEVLWHGRLSLKNASFDGNLSSGVHFLIKDINGTIHLIEDESGLKNHLGFSIIGRSRPDEKTFESFLDALTLDKSEGGDDILRIGEIEYGFLRLEDIEFALDVGRNKLNLKRFQSKLYDGSVFGTGLFEFDGKGEKRRYDFSFLFKDLSLKEASDSIPSTRDYITGRIDGVGWLSNIGGKLGTIDGAFNFWPIKSKKEPKTIGRALLTQLGVREKLLLRSSRKYDKGRIYGYIRSGIITFKELEISHTILGVKDLIIRVDSKRNSISVAHLLSVIRETAKRASEGRLKIEFENK